MEDSDFLTQVFLRVAKGESLMSLARKQRKMPAIAKLVPGTPLYHAWNTAMHIRTRLLLDEITSDNYDDPDTFKLQSAKVRLLHSLLIPIPVVPHPVPPLSSSPSPSEQIILPDNKRVI